MLLHRACRIAESGGRISSPHLTCLSLLSTTPKPYCDVTPLQSAPDPYLSSDTHVINPYEEGVHSFHQYHFPTGTLINSFNHVGKISTAQYRDSDGTAAACVQGRGGINQWYVCWARFGQDMIWKEFMRRGHCMSIRGDREELAMGVENSIFLFGMERGNVEEVGYMQGAERICTLAWTKERDHVLYGVPTGKVKVWDVREARGNCLFTANREGMAVSKLVTCGREIYASVNFNGRKGIGVWDERGGNNGEALRWFHLPNWGRRCMFDVDERAGVLVGGMGESVWAWVSGWGGEVVGEWNFRYESLKRVNMVGWGGHLGGIVIQTDVDCYYIPLGGWRGVKVMGG